MNLDHVCHHPIKLERLFQNNKDALRIEINSHFCWPDVSMRAWSVCNLLTRAKEARAQAILYVSYRFFSTTLNAVKFLYKARAAGAVVAVTTLKILVLRQYFFVSTELAKR